MSEDRWVRIVDPEHVLLVGIDEEWHPAYGTYGWKSEIIIDGTTVGACAAYKFRCRLRDVPPGTKIVDPGPDHELVDPWVTEPVGDEEYWHKSHLEWRPRPYPSDTLTPYSGIYRRPIRVIYPDQFAAATAAFRKAMEVSKTPQPGEWWFENDKIRVFIHGISRKGKAIFEMSDGYVASKDYWKGWHHEPACTGWDWQPSPKLEAPPVQLPLERRVELLERRLKKLEHQVSELGGSQ